MELIITEFQIDISLIESIILEKNISKIIWVHAFQKKSLEKLCKKWKIELVEFKGIVY